MARDLVALRRYVTHQRRTPLRHPPEKKEGRLRIRRMHQLQNLVGTGFYAQGQALPVRARYGRTQVLDLEPVFDIKRQTVGDAVHTSRRPRRRNSRTSWRVGNVK